MAADDKNWPEELGDNPRPWLMLVFAFLFSTHCKPFKKKSLATLDYRQLRGYDLLNKIYHALLLSFAIEVSCMHIKEYINTWIKSKC